MSRSAARRVFLFSWEILAWGLWETVVSSKVAPQVLDMKYKSEFKHGFTNPEAVARRCFGRPATLLKKIFWYRCFVVNFAKFLRIPFFI